MDIWEDITFGYITIMISALLKKKSLSFKLTVKGTISAILVILSVALPQLAHIIGGAQAGAIWMPMYAPALIAGCLLGWQWGLGVGIIAPICSFGFTTLALDSAMPALERLPYMTLELAMFGLVSGLFGKLIAKNPVVAFPAVLAAEVAGRAVYVVYNLIAGKSFAYLFGSVQTSLTGLFLYAILVPIVVIVLDAIIKKANE